MAGCASMAFLPGEVLRYQVAMLGIATNLPQSSWAICFFRMVGKRWLFVVEHQKFKLSRPDRSAPKLLKAINRALQLLDVRSCAKLLNAAAEAAALSISLNIAMELKKLMSA